MISGKELGEAGFRYLGVPYSRMDCQAFAEQCLRDCGLDMNLAGSNAWYREVMKNGAILSPEECVKQLGKVPAGAFLFIHAHDGGEPEKYRKDGLGNASHIGIVTGRGEGAIHSSSSRGCVAESAFRGKTVHGGWNRVGLWNRVVYDYGSVSGGNGLQPAAGEPVFTAEPETLKQAVTVTVWSENSKPVNLRKRPDKNAALVDRFPVGTDAELLESGPLWSRIRVKGKTGWMMTEFLVTDERAEPAEEVSADVSYCVTVFGLDLTQANALHLRYPDSVIERSVG